MAIHTDSFLTLRPCFSRARVLSDLGSVHREGIKLQTVRECCKFAFEFACDVVFADDKSSPRQAWCRNFDGRAWCRRIGPRFHPSRQDESELGSDLDGRPMCLVEWYVAVHSRCSQVLEDIGMSTSLRPIITEVDHSYASTRWDIS